MIAKIWLWLKSCYPFSNKEQGVNMRKSNMDGLSSAKIFEMPGYKAQALPDETSTKEKRGWFFRRLVELGVFEMADSQPKPPGFYVNATTIIGFIIIAATITGLFLYAVQSARESGYEKGKAEAERKALEIRLTKAEEDARRAKEWNMVKKDREEQSEEKQEEHK
jgi:hypothetical protein